MFFIFTFSFTISIRMGVEMSKPKHVWSWKHWSICSKIVFICHVLKKSFASVKNGENATKKTLPCSFQEIQRLFFWFVSKILCSDIFSWNELSEQVLVVCYFSSHWSSAAFRCYLRSREYVIIWKSCSFSNYFKHI